MGYTTHFDVNDMRMQDQGVNAQIHRTGCKDLARAARGTTHTADSLTEALWDALDTETWALGYREDTVQVMPCTGIKRSEVTKALAHHADLMKDVEPMD